jgi:uncharacterized phage-associated protein
MYDLMHSINWFLQKAASECETLNPIKLQKLLYIAHGWHLALFNKPLFNENFKAWEWGPVIDTFYDIALSYTFNNNFHHVAPDFVDKSKNDFLNKIWDTHKRLTTIDLASTLVKDNTPWHKIFAQEFRGLIPNDLIREYYLNLAGKP